MTSNQVTVTTSATLIVGPATDDRWIASIRNRGAVAIYLGGSAVTTSIGFQLDPLETASFDIPRGESLYGITASSTARTDLLYAEAGK